MNFLQDPIFSTLWYNLDIQMKQNTKAGVGLTTNQPEAITNEQEDQLWQKGILGTETPLALSRALFFLVGIHFGLRSGDEHRTLTTKNFTIENVQGGTKCLVYRETVSKTYQGGLKDKGRKPCTAKAFPNAFNPTRCIVNVFLKYTSLCPVDALQKSLYLNVRVKPTEQLWYTCQAIGHNKLTTMVKVMMEQAGISGYFSNHSLRATTATRLFQADIPEQLIKEQTGHRSNAIYSYKR